jgi:hypothetical protein
VLSTLFSPDTCGRGHFYTDPRVHTILQSKIAQKILAFSDNLRYNYSNYRFLVAQASACNGLIIKHFFIRRMGK